MVLGAAVVGFVAGIALALLLDEALAVDGGVWDVIGLLMGVAGAVLAVRFVHARARPRGPGARRHRHA